MTADQNKSLVLVDEAYDELAQAALASKDYLLLKKYIFDGGKKLAPATAASFFELFLNGNEVDEIHRLNKAFPLESILDARIRYKWDEHKEYCAQALHSKIKDKLIRAQLETASLLADMLTAANKKHGDRLKKYLQTGDEKDLGDALTINSIPAMLKVVDRIQKITGQDRQHKVTKEETFNLNLQSGITKSEETDDGMSADTAAKILSAIAEDKRKKAIGDGND